MNEIPTRYGIVVQASNRFAPHYHVMIPMNDTSSYEFTTRLTAYSGVYRTAMVVVPDEVVRQLPNTSRIRTEGTMNGALFALAVLRQRTGERYFVVSAALRKAAGISPGDVVHVRFHMVDVNKLELPEELQALLDVDPEMRAVWNTFSVGKQRGLVHYVASAKSTDTRIKRSLELLRKAMNGELYYQKKKD